MLTHNKVDHKRHYLGLYSSKEDAIIVRLDAERRYFGEFAPLENRHG